MGAGMSAIMGPRKPGTAGILFYHRIAPKVAGLPDPGLNVTPDRFRIQLEGLLERGFSFCSLRDLVTMASEGREVPGGTTVVTFDDAFAGVYRWALPVLRALKIPATVFPVTRYLDEPAGPMHFDMWGLAHHREAPADSWRSMTWAECRAAEATGLVEIGCHTHAHENFAGRSEELDQDLSAAQAAFLAELGGPRTLFAIPYGDPNLGQVDNEMLEVIQRHGHACALTTKLGLVEQGQSPFGWKRLEVVDQDTGGTLAAKIEGWYDWMGAVKTAVHRVSPW
ncbi:MAG: peptidoglycan/xylan/chitin deacetylase (PgdA/CDA1 family) [Rhodothermales bacterium]